jgi:hypothetical protein
MIPRIHAVKPVRRPRRFQPTLEELQPRDLPSAVIYADVAFANDTPGLNEGPGRLLRIDAHTGAVQRLYAGAPGSTAGPSGSILVEPGAEIDGAPLVTTPGGQLLFAGIAGLEIFNPKAAHPRPHLLHGNVFIQALAPGPHGAIYGIGGSIGGTSTDIVTINPSTGQFTTLWQDTAATGNDYLEGLAVLPTGRVIFSGSLHNGGHNALYQLDPTSAQPSPTLLDNDPAITAVAAGPRGELYGLKAIRGAHGAVYSLSGADAIVRIDPSTGKETTVFQTSSARFDASILTSLSDGVLLVHGSFGKSRGIFEINVQGAPHAHLLAANVDAGALAVARG